MIFILLDSQHALVASWEWRILFLPRHCPGHVGGLDYSHGIFVPKHSRGMIPASRLKVLEDSKMHEIP